VLDQRHRCVILSSCLDFLRVLALSPIATFNNGYLVDTFTRMDRPIECYNMKPGWANFLLNIYWSCSSMFRVTQASCYRTWYVLPPNISWNIYIKQLWIIGLCALFIWLAQQKTVTFDAFVTTFVPTFVDNHNIMCVCVCVCVCVCLCNRISCTTKVTRVTLRHRSTGILRAAKTNLLYEYHEQCAIFSNAITFSMFIFS